MNSGDTAEFNRSPCSEDMRLSISHQNRSNRILPPLAVAAAVFLLLGPAVPAVAQIPIPGQPPQQAQPQPQDTIEVEVFRVEPPVSPMGALWRSLLLPGWGQAALGRRVTGAFFVFWEGVTLGMTIKSAHQLSFQESTDAETVEAKRQEVQDWAVLLAFNHLMAGAEWQVPRPSCRPCSGIFQTNSSSELCQAGVSG